VRTSLFNLSPEGTAENISGRKSWATYMGLTSPRDNPRSSIPPRGDMFSAAIRILIRVYPGRCPGIFSAVPGGTTPGLMSTQDLRPGLLSAVPAGLKPEPAVLTQTLKAVLLPTIYGTAEAVPFVKFFRKL
jgi:hypothetical protein